jgi:hypothetical protein
VSATLYGRLNPDACIRVFPMWLWGCEHSKRDSFGFKDGVRAMLSTRITLCFDDSYLFLHLRFITEKRNVALVRSCFSCIVKIIEIRDSVTQTQRTVSAKEASNGS